MVKTVYKVIRFEIEDESNMKKMNKLFLYLQNIHRFN